MKKIIQIFTAIAAIVVLATATPTSIRADIEIQDECIQVFNLVNANRIEQGLEPLEYDLSLQEYADIRAQELYELYSHTRPNGSSWSTLNPSRLNGENIAAGQQNATSVMESWMNSQGHRENILRDSFKSMAIGYVYIEGHSF